MENQDIKRGIDFDARVGEFAPVISRAFDWWKGKTIGRKTFIYVSVVFVLNFIIIFPILGKDTSEAYSSTALSGVANFFHFFFIPKRFIFFLITFSSLTFAPISLYLFFRRITLRHESTAFLATLFFVLPNPFFNNVPILVNAIMNGDGAHVLVFSFIPVFLLYVQLFLKTGIPLLSVLCSVITAFIAVLSPFAVFNLIFIYTILTVAEGLLGDTRLKLLRLFFLFLTSTTMSAFWYYPGLLWKVSQLSHVKFAMDEIFSLAPLAIPAIPVLGVIMFLVFDGREKLNPIFTSTCLFLLYLFLYSLSASYNISGVFTAVRYLPELGLASSAFLSLLFVFLSQLLFRNFFPKVDKRTFSLLLFGAKVLGIIIVIALVVQGVIIVKQFADQDIPTPFLEGIGNLPRHYTLTNVSAYLAILTSVGTLTFMVRIARKFPSSVKRIAEERAKLDSLENLE